jgi:hypothetical protein
MEPLGCNGATHRIVTHYRREAQFDPANVSSTSDMSIFGFYEFTEFISRALEK